MKLTLKWISCLILSSVFLANAAEQPPYILVEQDLSFGKIAVTASATPSSISIASDGKMVAEKGIYILEIGHPAEFLMVNYSPYTQYTLSVFILDSKTTTGAISSNQFTLKTVLLPVTITTDSKGEASFFIGGTLETSGDISRAYLDTTYQARYVITVTY